MSQPLYANGAGGAYGPTGFADPYEPVKIPQMPDMRYIPPELQAFRDQCSAGEAHGVCPLTRPPACIIGLYALPGVRQAVQMITAMEHQLWWEKSRRQQVCPGRPTSPAT